MPDSEVSMFLSAHTDSFLSFSFENDRNACAKGLWHHVKTKARGKDKNMVIPVFLTLLEKVKHRGLWGPDDTLPNLYSEIWDPDVYLCKWKKTNKILYLSHIHNNRQWNGFSAFNPFSLKEQGGATLLNWAGAWGYLGNLRLQVPVFHLKVTLLSQSRGQGSVLWVEQSLQIFEPLLRCSQVWLLFSVSVKTKKEFIGGYSSQTMRRRQDCVCNLRTRWKPWSKFPWRSPIRQIQAIFKADEIETGKSPRCIWLISHKDVLPITCN